MDIAEAAEATKHIAQRVRMCFVPKSLDYLRAGGRVSNVVALTGNLLGLHPCIEILDGKLVAKKKYRGALDKLIPKLICEFAETHNLNKDRLCFIYSTGLEEKSRTIAEEAARSFGFKETSWMKTGCVITCHGGPGAFGIVGFAE